MASPRESSPFFIWVSKILITEQQRCLRENTVKPYAPDGWGLHCKLRLDFPSSPCHICKIRRGSKPPHDVKVYHEKQFEIRFEMDCCWTDAWNNSTVFNTAHCADVTQEEDGGKVLTTWWLRHYIQSPLKTVFPKRWPESNLVTRLICLMCLEIKEKKLRLFLHWEYCYTKHL